MVTQIEDWEGDVDEADVTTGNTVHVSSVIKVGAATVKFDNSQNPGGEGTQSVRMNQVSSAPGTGCSTLFTYTSPASTFDVEVWFRTTSLGTYFYPPGDALEGSLSGNTVFVQLTGGGDVMTFGMAGGHVLVLDPLTASGYFWLSADGNSLLPDRTGAGVWFSINTDHKLRLVGDLNTFDAYIDDVKLNNIPLPVAGPGTNPYTTIQLGVGRAGTESTWYGDFKFADSEVFIPMGPGGGVGGDPFL